MRTRDMIVAWVAYREQMNALGQVADSTLANQRQIVAGVILEIGNIPLTELRKSHIDFYAAHRLQICKPVTVEAELAVLRQALNWAVDESLLTSRPRLPTVSVPNTERPLPSDEDYLWFLRTMSPHHSEALEFMLLTGLAPHELERLQVRDVRRQPFQDNIYAVEIGMRADFAVKQESRKRLIPLNERAFVIWFSSVVGKEPTAAPFPRSDALQKAMRRHVIEATDAPAGADGLTPKMMRKWFASKIAVEHSEAVLQRLLGHAPGSPITRKHYVRTSASQLGTAVAGIGL